MLWVSDVFVLAIQGPGYEEEIIQIPLHHHFQHINQYGIEVVIPLRHRCPDIVSYAVISYLVPAVLRMNCFGISRSKEVIASHPEQCMGAMKSGPTALIPALQERDPSPVYPPVLLVK
jgi:hypothetical protein